MAQEVALGMRDWIHVEMNNVANRTLIKLSA